MTKAQHSNVVELFPKPELPDVTDEQLNAQAPSHLKAVG